MWNELEDRTRASLLARLRQTDDRAAWNGAWDLFYARYVPLVLSWCRKWHLQPADAEEVASAVLLTLGRRMESFDYDPSYRFRGWLKTVVENEMRGFLARRSRRPGDRGEGGSEDDPLAALADPEDAAAELADQLESQRGVLREGLAHVRERVQPLSWEAFERVAVRGEDPAFVAQELGMSVVAVYKAKSRALEQLREFAKLHRGEG